MLLDRIARDEITTEHLATHVISLSEAPNGYAMFKEKTEARWRTQREGWVRHRVEWSRLIRAAFIRPWAVLDKPQRRGVWARDSAHQR